MVPDAPARVINRYLRRLDRSLPGVLDGFYVVGSIALGGFRHHRSDIDFVATVAQPLSPEQLGVLRRVHRRCYAEGIARALAARSFPLVCNGVFVHPDDLRRSPASVRVVASQTAERFEPGSGFDVNPVTWWILAERGIRLRGPALDQLQVAADDAALRRWTAANLVSYWRPWAADVAAGGLRAWKRQAPHLHSRRLAAWGVFGTARMHATITQGGVLSKEQAGEYALATFDTCWDRVVQDALDYWQDRPSDSGLTAEARRQQTAAFVEQVVAQVGAG